MLARTQTETQTSTALVLVLVLVTVAFPSLVASGFIRLPAAAAAAATGVAGGGVDPGELNLRTTSATADLAV